MEKSKQQITYQFAFVDMHLKVQTNVRELLESIRMPARNLHHLVAPKISASKVILVTMPFHTCWK